MWCVSSLTHSSSHSQTFSIRAHSSLPGFFKRLEISSGGLGCHPNGNRSASKKGPSKKKPHTLQHHKPPYSGDKTSSQWKKLAKREIIGILRNFSGWGDKAGTDLSSQTQTQHRAPLYNLLLSKGASVELGECLKLEETHKDHRVPLLAGLPDTEPCD